MDVHQQAGPTPVNLYHQQPAAGVPVAVAPPPQGLVVRDRAWSTGLCDCCSDCTNCCVTCWCPCVTFGQIAEIIDQGSTSCFVSGAIFALIHYTTGCGYCYSCIYRKRMRMTYNLPARPCWDGLVHHYCGLCALCQEYRELKHLGFNMDAGWKGNVHKLHGVITMAPYHQGGMSR